MTMPGFFGAPAAPPGGQPGPRNARGELVMGGGYDVAIAQANGGQHPGGQQQQMVSGLNPLMQQAPVQQQPTWQQPSQQQQQQQQQWQPPQMPVFNPPPQNGLPIDGQPSPIQNQTWPIRQQQQPAPAWQQPIQQQYQQPPIQQQLPPGVDLNQRLSGPGIPPELQNRTLGELVGIHNGLRQIHLNQLAGGPQQQQIPPLSQQAPVQQQASVGQQQAAAWDWRDPAASTRRVVTEAVSEIVREQLQPALAPIQHQAMVGQITQARDRARMQFGDQYFAQLEPIINQSLAGIDPRALLNPQTWIVAAERALGQVARQGQMPQQQQVGVAQQQPNGSWGMNQLQPQGPGAYPLQIVQPGVQPLPNLSTFFSEAPGQGGPGSPGNMQLSQEQANAARLMGIPEATYAAWAGGMQQPGGRR